MLVICDAETTAIRGFILYLFHNASMIAARGDQPLEGVSILVGDEKILDVATDGRAIDSVSAQKVDCSGLTLLPGLIDCHVHVAAGEPDLGANALLPDSLVAARAVRTLERTLQRGFTTVRDAGGADLGLVRAIEEGTIAGPRLIICGQALSQTGGHGDFRTPFDERDPGYYKRRLGSISRICDGEAEIRKAAREEIRAGAKFIKIMANGGVSSPSDPIHSLQFSPNEILAAIEEAANAGLYVAAHLYTEEAIRRAVELGVHSIEHCNLVSTETAALMSERGAVACPTLIVFHASAELGASLGIPKMTLAKAELVRDAAYTALERLSEAGTEIVFGTDLTIAELMDRQSEEFRLRARVLRPREIIDQATTAAARLLRMEGQIGELAPGAFADIVGVRGNPLADIEVLAQPEKNVAFVMKSGSFVKNLH